MITFGGLNRFLTCKVLNSQSGKSKFLNSVQTWFLKSADLHLINPMRRCKSLDYGKWHFTRSFPAESFTHSLTHTHTHTHTHYISLTLTYMIATVDKKRTCVTMIYKRLIKVSQLKFELNERYLCLFQTWKKYWALA